MVSIFYWIPLQVQRDDGIVPRNNTTGFVAWLEKPTRCHSRVGGNPEK
ncbi:MAG TPA: hypothetical protein LFV92_03390 [Rickettsia endosymbiont of Ceroptres masudai]|nr:hypothetical protein [Rickettsia endosymbiont of Ceroptres masudai]